MMMDYFNSLEAGLQAAIDGGNGSLRKHYSLEIARLGKRLYSRPQKVAWCGVTAPYDLLNAIGFTSCFV